MKQVLVELRDGLSLEEQLLPIQVEWGTGSYHELLLHVYSGWEDEEHTVGVARALAGCFPEAHVVGTMSAGEIAVLARLA